MAITSVQLASNGSLSATSAGNLVVACYRGSTAAPTDNKGTTYSVVSRSLSGALVSIAYTLSCASGITTITPPAGGTIIFSGEYTGGTGSFSLDTSTTGALNNVSISNNFTQKDTTANLTPAGDNELLICHGDIKRFSGTRTLSILFSPGFFTSLSTFTSASEYEEAMQWIQTTATATTTDWGFEAIGSGSSNYSWAVAVVAFIFTASGGASYLPQLMTMGIG